MRNPTGKSQRRRIARALLVAVVGHAVALAALALFVPCSGDPASAPPGRGSIVSVVPVVDPPPTPDPSPRQQHVALPEPEREEEPEEASFADRFNRTVERETVAHDDIGPPRPTPSPASVAARRGERDGEGEETVAMSIPSAAEGGVSPSDGGDADPGPSAGPVPTHIGVDELGTSSEGVPESPSHEGQALDLTVFNASVNDPRWERGGQRLDYLELEDGDRTMLNSERSIYWSFFERMRRQISQNWNPGRAYRRHDPTGVAYPRLDRLTVIDFTLSHDGSLREAIVFRGSGLDFLDDEAIFAMRASAPFRNPPEGLKDERGLIALRFAFIVTFDGSVSLRRLPTF